MKLPSTLPAMQESSGNLIFYDKFLLTPIILRMHFKSIHTSSIQAPTKLIENFETPKTIRIPEYHKYKDGQTE